MSPNGVSNFMHELLEAAQAKEQLPVVQAEVNRLAGELAHAQDTIQTLQIRIIDLKNANDEAHRATREAEAQRDSAEALFLECDDKRLALHRWIEGMVKGAGDLVRAAEPVPTTPSPVAVPISEPVPADAGVITGTPNVDSQTVVPSDPTTSTSESGSSPTTSDVADGSGGAQPADVGSGERHDMFPEPEYYQTPDGGSATPSVQPDPTQATVPSSESGSPVSPPQPERPYAGKLYDNHPAYVPLSQWLAGGGTEVSYYWRRGNPLPEGYTDDPARAAS